jgi:hypothetical protein
MNSKFQTVALILLLAFCTNAQAKTIRFSGYDWTVRPSENGGPGPNHWDENNVWIDELGRLHLKLTHQNGKWFCAEIYTNQSLGFGSYQFQIVGGLDKLDPNVVFGLFNYPEPEVGPDGTNEIDIEFARWGHSAAPICNYTVWPVNPKLDQAGVSFPAKLSTDESTQRFIWSPAGVSFQSLQGFTDGNTGQFAGWNNHPPDPAARVSQKPMPVHINLWCFKGRAPGNGQPVEVIISAFKFKGM